MGKIYNLARVTTATTGQGTITLGTAVSGFLTFAGAGASDGETLSYGISDGAASEVGTGVYTASGTTLTRTVTKSTNGNNALILSGTAEVFITPRAEDFANLTSANTWAGVQTFGNATEATGAGTTAAALFSGGVEIAKKLFVTGAASLASTLAITGDFAVNTNKFTVAAASGNTAIAGTLAVTGVSTLTGVVTLSSYLNFGSQLGTLGQASHIRLFDAGTAALSYGFGVESGGVLSANSQVGHAWYLNGTTRLMHGDATRINVPLTTASTLPTNGALTIPNGGLGVGGDINWVGAGWTAYTPTIAPQTGAFAIAPTIVATYKTFGKLTTVRVSLDFAAASMGTAAGSISISLPNSISVAQSASGSNLTNSRGLSVILGFLAANTMNVFQYDGAFPVANSQRIVVSAQYEST